MVVQEVDLALLLPQVTVLPVVLEELALQDVEEELRDRVTLLQVALVMVVIGLYIGLTTRQRRLAEESPDREIPRAFFAAAHGLARPGFAERLLPVTLLVEVGFYALVRSGSVEIYKQDDGQEISLAVLQPGELFGEMALFTGEPRKASAKADADIKALRIDKPSIAELLESREELINAFVASMIQAELAGASMSETLRRQADDLRDRRKMQALLLSQALPVKLVFPLVLCMFPAMFVVVAGPAVLRIVKVLGDMTR